MVMGHPPELFPQSSLYASMYGGQGSGSQVARNLERTVPLLPQSAFHSPLHDLKAHSASTGLSMDWLARAGLLYHRTPGESRPPLTRVTRRCSVRVEEGSGEDGVGMAIARQRTGVLLMSLLSDKRRREACLS